MNLGQQKWLFTNDNLSFPFKCPCQIQDMYDTSGTFSRFNESLYQKGDSNSKRIIQVIQKSLYERVT